MTEPDVPNRRFEALAQGLWDAERPGLCAPYVDAYLEAAPEVARRRGQGFSLTLGRDAFPSVPLTDAQRARLRELLEGGEVPTVLARQWDDALDDIS
jgi:aminopeptidase N